LIDWGSTQTAGRKYACSWNIKDRGKHKTSLICYSLLGPNEHGKSEHFHILRFYWTKNNGIFVRI